MRTLPSFAALATCLAVVSGARAQLAVESSVRTGILVPTGSATGSASDDLGDTFGVQLPLFLDVGLQPVPRLFVGAYGGVGVGGAGGDTSRSCDTAGASCAARSTRAGAEVHWHFRERNVTHAWLGYGVGYEWARLIMSADAGTQLVSYRGPEYAHLMFGIDFAPREPSSPQFARIGLLIDYSLASYTNMRVKSWTSPAITVDSFETSTHGWLMLGLRGVLLP